METKTINPFIVYIAIIVITVFATLQYKNYEMKNAAEETKNSTTKNCNFNNQLTRNLTPTQFSENMAALIKQDAPVEDLHGYINCYTRTSDGNFSLTNTN